MNKTIIYAICLAFSLQSMCSCNNEVTSLSDSNPSTQEEQLLSLKNDIATYNKTHLDKEQVQTRGLFSKLKRFFVIVAADMGGALSGAVAGAAAGPVGAVTSATTGAISASVLAAKRLKDEAKNKTKNVGTTGTNGSQLEPKVGLKTDNLVKMDDSANLIFSNSNSSSSSSSNQNSAIDSLGYYHNLVIKEMQKEQPDWINLNQDQVSQRTMVSIKKYASICNSEDLKNDDVQKSIEYAKYISEAAGKATSVDDFCKALSKKYPNLKSQIAVLQEVLNGWENCDLESNEVAEYTKSVLKIIDSKNMDENVRSQIVSGVLVGNASSNLWNPESFE